METPNLPPVASVGEFELALERHDAEVRHQERQSLREKIGAAGSGADITPTAIGGGVGGTSGLSSRDFD